MKTLIPDEVKLLQITCWIDRKQISGILEDVDFQIKDIENRWRWDELLEDDKQTIERLLANVHTVLKATDKSDSAISKQDAIKKLIDELDNWDE